MYIDHKAMCEWELGGPRAGTRCLTHTLQTLSHALRTTGSSGGAKLFSMALCGEREKMRVEREIVSVKGV